MGCYKTLFIFIVLSLCFGCLTDDGGKDGYNGEGDRVVYLSESFDDLSGWNLHLGGEYVIDKDQGWNGSGVHIHGDGLYNFPNLDRIVDISGWSGGIWLELDFRAKSFGETHEYTNAYVLVFDDSKSSLRYVGLLAGGGIKDTGWKHRKIDLTEYLDGVSSMKVRLQLQDHWEADHSQEAWFDEVELYSSVSEQKEPGEVTPGAMFLDEDFSDLSCWDIHMGGLYQAELGEGVDDSGLHIFGDGPNNFPNVDRIVDISGADSVWLELDFRAKSSSGTHEYTNAYVQIFDPDKKSLLHIELLAGGGFLDTGWRHRRIDLSNALSGLDSIKIRLLLEDNWEADHSQEAWFDNVKIFSAQ